ncbi:MAG: glycosyltransferase family 39 protein [Alphaproteobacteria bacterium]|nr:glycosyltransferase family 39 protein [Alphaproteobacteria bacterium]
MILKNSLSKSSVCWCVGILALCVAVNYLVGAFTMVFGADEREHMHASFMVLSGLVPYRDFFEHHHPLFWYLLQPFIYFFGDNPSVWVYARGVVVLLNGGIAYFIYKICRQAGLSLNGALVAAVSWFAFFAVQKSGTELRPDLLMILFYLAGLYSFFLYLQQKRYGWLLLSFVLFFCSFLTLQKVIFLFAGQFFIILRQLFKKRILLFDFVLACGSVLVLCLLAVWVLYQAGALEVYFRLNWLFNLHIRVMPMVEIKHLYIFIAGAVCGGGILFCSKNEIMRDVAFLYLFIGGVLLVWRPWFYHYLLPYCALLAIIFGYVVYEPLFKLKWAPFVMLVLACFFAKQAYDKWRLSLNNAFRLSVYHNVLAFMLEKTGPKDLVLGNGEDMVATLRHSALGYYWFSVGSLATLDNRMFSKKELPDYDLIIKARKPKAVVNGFWRNCALGDMYIANRDCPFWEGIDRDYLNQHYTDYGFVFIRKD